VLDLAAAREAGFGSGLDSEAMQRLRDGPRGPRMRANDGVLDLPLLTGLPILPVAIGTSAGKLLNSWDGFLVPQPFSRIAVRWGEPLSVDRGDDRAATSARLEAALNALQQAADRAVYRRCTV